MLHWRPEKTGEKRFYQTQTERFALTGFLSKTENRVGKKGVTYAFYNAVFLSPKIMLKNRLFFLQDAT